MRQRGGLVTSAGWRGAQHALVLALAAALSLVLGAAPAQAQSPQAPSARQTPRPAVAAVPRGRVEHSTAEFSGLDKITGRITRFEVRIGETVQFGALQVTPRACIQRLSGDQQVAGFIEVDEITLRNEIRRIFGGWMFAASPGLNAVEHPIFDIWLSQCAGGSVPVAQGPNAGYQGEGEPPPLEQAPVRRPRRPATAPQQEGVIREPPPGPRRPVN